MKTKTMKALSANELRNVTGGCSCGFGINPDGTGCTERFPGLPGIGNPFDIIQRPIFF